MKVFFSVWAVGGGWEPEGFHPVRKWGVTRLGWAPTAFWPQGGKFFDRDSGISGYERDNSGISGVVNPQLPPAELFRRAFCSPRQELRGDGSIRKKALPRT